MIVNNSPAVMKALSNLRKQIVDGCPICHGSELGCRCRFKMMLYEEAAKSNVPMGVISKTFSDFGLGQEDNEMVVALKDKWKHIIYDVEKVVAEGRLIVVSGSNGTGKTMLSCVTIKSAIASKLTTQYVLFNQLVDAFLGHRDEFVHHALGVDLLVIDEVGKEYKKVNQFGEFDSTSNMASYSKYVMGHVVKVRADSGMTTMLVTNDTPAELEAKYGEVGSALSSVLNASSTIYVFHSGIDFRGQNG